MRSRTTSLLAVSVCAVAAHRAVALPAFPGAEGFGANATGGRGGDVYHVTTLANDPDHLIPGSLFYGLYEKNVPAGGRTIVFDVGGTIDLNSGPTQTTLDIKNIKNVTIAGQTAPSPITIISNTTQITSSSGKETGNIILQYLTFRKGLANSGDSLTIKGSGNTHDIMVDHVSASWSEDEVISTAGATNHATNVTVQYSTMSEALTPGHQYGSLIRMNQDASVSYNHNLYSDNASRNPRPGSYLGTTLQFEFQNNVIYNWSDRAGYTGGDGTAVEPVYMNYQGNYLIAGPSTPAGYPHSTIAFTKDLGDGHPLDLKVYQSGNKIDSNHNAVRDGVDTGWGMFTVSDGSALPDTDKRVTPWPYPSANSADSADDAYAKVLASVGAFPYSRSTTDRRLINEVMTNTGVAAQSSPNAAEWAAITANAGTPTATRPADWDTDKDGMPNWWETQHGFNPAVADNNVVTADGYTRLEHYLQYLTAIANWNLDGDGAWSGYLNWRGTRPTTADATANFVAGNTAPRTVTLDIPVTVGQLSFSSNVGYTLAGPNTLTFSVISGRAQVSVTAGSHRVDAPVLLQSGADVQVASGATLTLSNVLPTSAPLNKIDAGTLRTGPLSLSSLTVAGGTLQLLPSAGPSSVTSLSISAGAAVDVMDNTLTVTSTADAIRQHLQAGRLVSSSPDPNGLHSLGYLANSSAVTVQLTYTGDANLDGVVNADDYALLDRGFTQHLAAWSGGDFNYDGVVDQNDYLLIDRVYSVLNGSPSPALIAEREAEFGAGYVTRLLTSIPEPAAVGWLSAVLPLARRRRRR